MSDGANQGSVFILEIPTYRSHQSTPILADTTATTIAVTNSRFFKGLSR
jgi:hypothetical protein